jgi:hypothetical protein
VKSTLTEIQENETTDKSVNLLQLWRSSELGAAFFAILSMISATIDYEYNFSPYREYHNCRHGSTEDSDLRWVTCFSSFAGIVFVLLGTYTHYQWEDYILLIDQTSEYKTSKKFLLRPVLEILLFMVFPYPKVNFKVYENHGINEHYIQICYNYSELVYSFMWLRLYFVLKIVLDYSPFVGHVARRATLENRVKNGIAFSFKCLFRSDPMMMIVFFIGIPSIVACGMMTRTYERPLIDLSQQDWENPVIAIWFSYSSMMLGVYGDNYPFSTMGKTTNVFSYIIGTLFFVLIFVNMENQTYLTRKQRKAFNDISITIEAANTIKSSIKFYIASKIGGSSRREALKHFQKNLTQFSHKRKYLLDMPRHRDLDIVDLMRKIRKMRRNMDRVHSKLAVAVQLINKKRSLV